MESSCHGRTLPEKSDGNFTRLYSSALKTFEKTHLDCKKEANEASETTRVTSTLDNEQLRQQHNTNQSVMKKMCAPIATTIEDKKLPYSIYVHSHHSTEKDSHEEDDGSVSSLDSVEELPSKSSSRHQRSIFDSYWKHSITEEGPPTKQEELSCSLTERISSCSFSSLQSRSLSHEDEFVFQEFNRDFRKKYRTIKSTCCDYEAILHNNEIGRTSIPHAILLSDETDIETMSKSTMNSTISQSFRSLFKTKYSTSSPSLSYDYLDSHATVRKTSSASSLRKKQHSCLRNRSSSLDSTIVPGSLQSSSSKSVSFDPKVFVHQYEKPHDRYTSNGWSKWFV